MFRISWDLFVQIHYTVNCTGDLIHAVEHLYDVLHLGILNISEIIIFPNSFLPYILHYAIHYIVFGQSVNYYFLSILAFFGCCFNIGIIIFAFIVNSGFLPPFFNNAVINHTHISPTTVSKT